MMDLAIDMDSFFFNFMMNTENSKTVTVQEMETPVPVERVVGERSTLDRQLASARVREVWSQISVPEIATDQNKKVGSRTNQDQLQIMLKKHSALLQRLVLDIPTYREKRVCTSTPVSPNTSNVDLTWNEEKRSSVALS